MHGVRPVRRHLQPNHGAEPLRFQTSDGTVGYADTDTARRGSDTVTLFPHTYETSTDDWYTPAWIFDAMQIRFDLDVAAPKDGVPWIPADKHYSIEDDGLWQGWEGTVWCNPPFSDPKLWVKQMVGYGDGCILVKDDLSTSSGFLLWSNADAMWVPKGRLSFVDGQQSRVGTPPFSTVMFGFGAKAVNGMERLGSQQGKTRVFK